MKVLFNKKEKNQEVTTEPEWVDDRIDEKKEDDVDYVKKIHSAKRINLGFKILCNIIIIAVICFVGIGLYGKYQGLRNECHTETPDACIEMEKYELTDMIYDVAYKEAYVLDGVTYYKVEIGDITVTAKADDISQLEEMDSLDTALKTNVYLLTFKNTEEYFMSSMAESEVSYIRFSCLGATDFSDKEIEEYKTHAKNYFTYKKYKLHRFTDYMNYEENVPDQITQKMYGSLSLRKSDSQK